MPPFPSLAVPLTDGHVAVRYFSERDIPEILIAYQDDRRLHEQLGERRPPSGAELGRESELAEAARLAGTRVALSILEAGSDECRGRVIVYDVDWEAGSAELALWVAPQRRGRGLAQGALRLCSDWLFDACGLRRLQLSGMTVTPSGERR